MFDFGEVAMPLWSNPITNLRGGQYYEVRLLVGVSLLVGRHVLASKSNLLLMISFLVQESRAV